MPIAYFPDKILEIGQRQAELLVDLKILTPKGNHEFWGEDSQRALLAMIEHPEVMLCDFCRETPVVTEYPCEDFIALATESADSGSIGQWMACQLCSERIDAGDVEGLSERAIHKYIEQHPEENSIETHIALDLGLRGLHRSFMEHRTGPGKRI
jgi:hypothetical protein